MIPATRPASIPPKKPAPIELAKYAPIAPGAIPALSLIEYEIKPPRIGINNVNPAIPIVDIAFRKPVSGTAALPLIITARANNTPPATTNGII